MSLFLIISVAIILAGLYKDFSSSSCLGVTTLFVTEKPRGRLTSFDFEQYVMDGVLELSFTPKDDAMARTLMVHKMIATNFPNAHYLFDISEKGMELVTTYI